MSALKFQSDIRKFVSKTSKNMSAIGRGSAHAALNSIKYGSEITGAPGQPEQSGALIDSWVMEERGVASALIYSDSSYARQNEDGIARPGGGPYIQQSARGGRWSVSKTKSGFSRLVDYVTETIANRGRR
jgi:hypothetical protein